MHHAINFSILWGPPYGLKARLPPLNWLVHSANVPAPNTKCSESDRGQDYNDKAVQPSENRDETGAACHYKEVLVLKYLLITMILMAIFFY